MILPGEVDALLQVAIQVPALALVVGVVWKLGILAITKWADGDDKRTEAVARGFSEITSRLNDHSVHLARLDEKLDMAIERTPVVPNDTHEFYSVPKRRP